MSDALVRETLAHTMQIVANSAIRNGQADQLDRVLGRILHDPDMAISAVLDSAGERMAGGPRGNLGCVRDLVARAGQLSEMHVWADCGGRVRLIVLPLQRPAEAIVIARRTRVIDRDAAASRLRIAVTSVALAVLGSLVILLVLRVWLAGPWSGSWRGCGSWAARRSRVPSPFRAAPGSCGCWPAPSTRWWSGSRASSRRWCARRRSGSRWSGGCGSRSSLPQSAG